MKIKAFITHKQAELFSNCQDRFGVNVDTKSVAVSDGMGATWQQKIWAQLLVDEFINSEDWLPDIDTIKPLCSKWRKEVEAYIQHLKDTNAPEYLIRMNKRSLLEGRSAGATFVGIRFNEKTWSGSVLGDSCLIEWNGHEAKFHTSQNRETFDNFPDYFDSDVKKTGKGAPKLIDGILADGDCLLLVSDPLSDFLLKNYNRGHKWQYISQLLGISSHEEFETLVARWRKEGMHDDDTTLVIVDNDGLDDFSIVVSDDIDTLIEKENLGEKQEQKANNEPKVCKEEQIKKENEIALVVNEDSAPIDENTFIEEFSNKLKNRKKEKKVLIKDVVSTLKKMFEKYTIFKK